MSAPITLSGFSSGIPVSQIIEQLMAIERRPITLMEQQISTINSQQSVYNSLQTQTTRVQSALTTLSANTFSNPDLFNRKTATSSDATNATATVTNSAAAPQTLNVNVINTATATRAQSTGVNFSNRVGQGIASGTLVRDIFPKTISSGTLTVFDGTNAYTVTVDNNADIQTFFNNLNTTSGGAISGSVDAATGQIQLTTTSGNNLRFGDTNDTSNFADVTGLKFSTPASTVNSRSLTSISLSAAVTTAAANLNTTVAGGSTFTIGSASFSADGKSLSTLINEINASAAAGVTASFNSTTNRLELISKSTGSQFIYLEDTSGNFLQAMNLISGSDFTSSQTQGQNASFEVNGNTFSSASNSVGSDITGLDGVTLNLVDAGTTTINITKNTTPLIDGIKTFITEFNSLISNIDANTNAQAGGRLAGDQSLLFFRNNMRRIVSDRVATTTPYETMASVGISTGAVTGTAAAATSNALVLDEAKLQAAIDADPEKVKEMMIGASTGILTRLKATVDAALINGNGTNDGLFAARTTSANTRITQINRSIERAERRLETKEAMLRRQFAAMETAISRFLGQGSALSGLSAQLSANR
jgi:flagellar hook-associated protein 2